MSDDLKQRVAEILESNLRLVCMDKQGVKIIRETIKELVEREGKLVTCLKFYANEENYYDGVIGSIQRYGWGEDWGNDNGKTAVSTLKDLGINPTNGDM